jgi:hypothetical protein
VQWKPSIARWAKCNIYSISRGHYQQIKWLEFDEVLYDTLLTLTMWEYRRYTIDYVDVLHSLSDASRQTLWLFEDLTTRLQL